MAELGWRMMSSLVMLQVLSCTAASGETSSRTKRDGTKVTFPCEREIHGHKCDRTTWLFTRSGSTKTVALFEYGEIKGDKDRLKVTEGCSLVIEKVKGRDAGRYFCRQFESGSGQQVGRDVVHHLSVDTTWWGPLVCVPVGAAALVLITLGVVAWRRTEGDDIHSSNCCGRLLLNEGAQRVFSGNQTKRDDDAADPEGDVAYASVSFTENPGRAQAGLHPDEEDGAVAYTTLKPPRSSAAADPGDLYATVNRAAR
ncbi:uncharacterized protein AB9W97_003127 [Spinachia spinachia]